LRSRRGTGVLLDTSFILPTLGIDVGGEVLRGLRALADSGLEVYYSRFSILEALWVAARRLSSPEAREALSEGLTSILESGVYREVREDAWVFAEAARLYALGHRDMIDNILYAASVRYNLRFLTLDRELKEFVRRIGLRDTLVSPDELTA